MNKTSSIRMRISLSFYTDHGKTLQSVSNIFDEIMDVSSSYFQMDETPTPTRFIRNCEEVGLFQDLQRINPFEETFRIAAQSSSNSSLSANGPDDDKVPNDTLNTPSFIPTHFDRMVVNSEDKRENTAVAVPGVNVDQNEEAIIPKKRYDGKNTGSEFSETEVESMKYMNGIITDQPVCLLDLSSPHEEATASNNSSKMKESATTVTCSVEVPNSSTQLQKINSYNEKSVNSSSANVHFERNHVVIRKDQLMISPINLRPKNGLSSEAHKLRKLLPMKTDHLSLKEKIKGKLRQRIQASSPVVNKNVEPISQQRSLSENDDREPVVCDENFDVRSRNRAAQRRHRNKKKQTMEELKSLLVKVIERNKDLEKRIIKEKQSNTQLKTLLLAHKNCPINQTSTTNEAEASTVLNNEQVIQYIERNDNASTSGCCCNSEAVSISEDDLHIPEINQQSSNTDSNKSVQIMINNNNNNDDNNNNNRNNARINQIYKQIKIRNPRITTTIINLQTVEVHESTTNTNDDECRTSKSVELLTTNSAELHSVHCFKNNDGSQVRSTLLKGGIYYVKDNNKSIKPTLPL